MFFLVDYFNDVAGLGMYRWLSTEILSRLFGIGVVGSVLTLLFFGAVVAAQPPDSPGNAPPGAGPPSEAPDDSPEDSDGSEEKSDVLPMFSKSFDLEVGQKYQWEVKNLTVGTAPVMRLFKFTDGHDTDSLGHRISKTRQVQWDDGSGEELSTPKIEFSPSKTGEFLVVVHAAHHDLKGFGDLHFNEKISDENIPIGGKHAFACELRQGDRIDTSFEPPTSGPHHHQMLVATDASAHFFEGDLTDPEKRVASYTQPATDGGKVTDVFVSPAKKTGGGLPTVGSGVAESAVPVDLPASVGKGHALGNGKDEGRFDGQLDPPPAMGQGFENGNPPGLGDDKFLPGHPSNERRGVCPELLPAPVADTGWRAALTPSHETCPDGPQADIINEHDVSQPMFVGTHFLLGGQSYQWEVKNLTQGTNPVLRVFRLSDYPLPVRDYMSSTAEVAFDSRVCLETRFVA